MKRAKTLQQALAATAALCTLAGCQASAGAMDPAMSLLANSVVGQPAPIQAGSASGEDTGSAHAVLGEACHSDASHVCLALKYVTYRYPASGNPVVSESDAIENVRAVNQLWGTCGVAFEIEQYAAVDPAEYGLAFETASYAELDGVRSAFAEPNELLIVTTGTWDRSGTLGRTASNAWTTMPGGAAQGTVLEEPVGVYGNLIGHELGHYLNLLHVSDDADLMNPVVYSGSVALSAQQCATVRAASDGGGASSSQVPRSARACRISSSSAWQSGQPSRCAATSARSAPVSRLDSKSRSRR